MPFILKRIGFFFIDNWKVIAIAFAILFVTVFVYRACNKPPKLDEKAIQKAQDAIAKEDRKQMIEILAESDTKEAAIDSNIKAVEQATEDAKVSYNGKTNAELAAELERRASQ